jgi:hypothetical protein
MTRKELETLLPPEHSHPDPTVQVSLRLPARLVSRVVKLAVDLRPPPGVTRVSPALVYRLALERGLDALETEAESGR